MVISLRSSQIAADKKKNQVMICENLRDLRDLRATKRIAYQNVQ